MIQNPGRTFAYCRVSTTEQTTENQVQAIRARDFEVDPLCIVEEQISGSVPAMERPKFRILAEHQLFPGDTLIVLKVDRLGRDNVDVQNTVNMLLKKGINLICLDLPEPDLRKPAGKMMLQMFAVFAEFERNKIIERTREGLSRARAAGKKLGRRAGSKHTANVQECKARGMSQSEAAAFLNIGIATVKRNWNPPA